MIVDSYRFLPRSFRPLYEGRGAFPGEGGPVWAPVLKRLAEMRVGLLSSAGVYCKRDQACFDLEREQSNPEWGDPSWRVISASTPREDLAFGHLHINDEDLTADPEIALPMRLLAAIAEEGVIGGAVANHIAVMGYQDRSLEDWRRTTAPAIVEHLRAQQADALVLAPA